MALDFARIADALRHQTLAEVAARLGVEAADVRDALVAEGRDRGAQDTIWWPEAVRRLENESLRAVARYFLCEPRRIRRALAREGLRVAGVTTVDRRVPQLQYAPIGAFPDADIARRTRVIPQAVAGERRRRNIPAHQPGKRRRWTPVEPEVVRVARVPESAVTSKPPRDVPASPSAVSPTERVSDPGRERDRRVRLFLRGEHEETAVQTVDFNKNGRRVPLPPPPQREAPAFDRSLPVRRATPAPAPRRPESGWRSIVPEGFVSELDVPPPTPQSESPQPVPAPAPAPVAVVKEPRVAQVALPVALRWRAVFVAGPNMHLDATTLGGALDEARARAGADPLRVERLAG